MLADYKNNIKQIEHLEDQLQCSFNEIELLNDEIDDMYEELCSARKENN
jgi:peptidoglycan hydrolase CwlO-like protein